MASRTRATCLFASAKSCLVESIEPSLTCIGLIASIAVASFSQLGFVAAQDGSFLVCARAAALPPETQDAMLIQKFLLSSSSIESSPKMSLSAKTTTRPLPKVVAATSAASDGVAAEELVAIT